MIFFRYKNIELKNKKYNKIIQTNKDIKMRTSFKFLSSSRWYKYHKDSLFREYKTIRNRLSINVKLATSTR